MTSPHALTSAWTLRPPAGSFSPPQRLIPHTPGLAPNIVLGTSIGSRKIALRQLNTSDLHSCICADWNAAYSWNEQTFRMLSKKSFDSARPTPQPAYSDCVRTSSSRSHWLVVASNRQTLRSWSWPLRSHRHTARKTISPSPWTGSARLRSLCRRRGPWRLPPGTAASPKHINSRQKSNSRRRCSTRDTVNASIVA